MIDGRSSRATRRQCWLVSIGSVPRSTRPITPSDLYTNNESKERVEKGEGKRKGGDRGMSHDMEIMGWSPAPGVDLDIVGDF